MNTIYLILFQVIIFTTWQVWAALEGRREANRFYKQHEYGTFTRDIHKEFSLQRLFVGVLTMGAFIIPYICKQPILLILLIILAYCCIMVFSFTFWHDGILFHRGHKINPEIYNKGFKDFKDGPANFEFPYNIRLTMFIMVNIVFAAIQVINNFI